MAESKPAYKSKTIWSGIATVVVAFATFVGLNPNILDFVADGIQWTDVTMVCTAIGGFAIYWGRRSATQPVEGIVSQK